MKNYFYLFINLHIINSKKKNLQNSWIENTYIFQLSPKWLKSIIFCLWRQYFMSLDMADLPTNHVSSFSRFVLSNVTEVSGVGLSMFAQADNRVSNISCHSALALREPGNCCFGPQLSFCLFTSSGVPWRNICNTSHMAYQSIWKVNGLFWRSWPIAQQTGDMEEGLSTNELLREESVRSTAFSKFISCRPLADHPPLNPGFQFSQFLLWRFELIFHPRAHTNFIYKYHSSFKISKLQRSIAPWINLLECRVSTILKSSIA